MRITFPLATALLAACSTGARTDATTDSATTATAAPAPVGASAAAAATAGDPDQATGGSGVPAGYTGRTDNPGAAISGAKYAASGGQWDVTTGPAHIVYKASDTGTGEYTAAATFEQLEAPRHPEAYGLFIGGENLDQPSQRYTYFIVRGTGEYAVKVRDGATARDVIAFRANDAVPKADGSGRGSYRLAAHVAADSVHLIVNDKPVGAVAKAGIPTEGIAGLRVNHNLHVRTGPVTITK